VVLVLLGPADEDRPVAVQPGVAGLDDPAPGAPAGSENLLGDLLATGADVRRQLVVGDEVADFGVVIGLVQAEALRSLRGRFGSLDRDRVQRAFQQLVVVAVRAVVIEPDRNPRRVGEDRAFRPFWLCQWGLGPSSGRLTVPSSSRRPPT
jgi:hypothetical protein